MSYEVYDTLVTKLNFQDLEMQNYHYARVFFQNTAMAKEFQNKVNDIGERIQHEHDIKIEAYLVGKEKSIVMIYGLGTLLERSERTFQVARNIIREYTEGRDDLEPELTVQASAKSEDEESASSGSSRRRRRRRKPKKKEEADGGGDGASGEIEGMKYGDKIEKFICQFMVDNEVTTRDALLRKVADRESLSGEDGLEKAGKTVDAWIEKNKDGGIDYDPDHGDGEGLITKFIV